MNQLLIVLTIIQGFGQYQLQDSTQNHTIYVVSISWHTGLVVPGNSLPADIWPDSLNYNDAAFLEIGWGDRDFYQTPGFDAWHATKAAFWPTTSVLHINPIPENVEAYYHFTDVVKLQVSKEQLDALSNYILSHFEYDEEGQVIPLQSGIHFDSQFFAGISSYYFPNNSNVWAARGLKRAGFRTGPILLQTTEMVLNKADNYGERIE